MGAPLPAENGLAEVSDQDREQAEQAKARGNDAFAGLSSDWRRPASHLVCIGAIMQAVQPRVPV